MGKEIELLNFLVTFVDNKSSISFEQMVGEVVDLGLKGEMRKERVFDFWFDKEVVDMSGGGWIFCVRSGDENVSADLGLIDGFVVSADSNVGLGDEKGVIGVTERGVGIGFDFKDQLAIRIWGDFEGLAELEIGVAEGKFYIGVGNDIFISERASGVGGNPGFDGGVEKNGLIGVVGDLVGLGNGSAGFENDFELGWGDG